jgi:alkyl hydroperoxide reductase subunit AhpC
MPSSDVRALFLAALAAALVVPMLPAAAQQAQAPARPPLAQVPPAASGAPFPAAVFSNLNAGAGGPERVDLAEHLGKRAIVFSYWIPTHERAEATLLELQAMADQLGRDKLTVLAAGTPPLGVDAAGAAEWTRIAKERVAALKLRIPVLLDEGFRLGQQFGVQEVPSVSVVDAAGVLRLASAGSLRQQVEYKLDVGGAIRRMVASGSIGTYGRMPHYNPATELVGQKVPDFQATSVGDGVMRRYASLLAPDRVNVLVFWSVDCPHCRESLPKINAWLRRNPDGIRVVSLAAAATSTLRARTEEFSRLSGLTFPVLLDRDHSIGQRFNITAVPTTLIIRPDGVVDSVLTSGATDYERLFEAKKRELLKPRS